jgi:hypothetical protein
MNSLINKNPNQFFIFFSDQQMLTGNYTLGTFFNHAIAGIFWSIFFLWLQDFEGTK